MPAHIAPRAHRRGRRAAPCPRCDECSIDRPWRSRQPSTIRSHLLFACVAQDLALGAAGLDAAGSGGQPELLGQAGDLPARAFDHLIVDLHHRHQGVTHRLDRHEFDHVQQPHDAAAGARQLAGSRGHGAAVLRQVDGCQNAAVGAHRHCKLNGSRPHPRVAAASASAPNCAGVSVSARAPGSMPSACIGFGASGKRAVRCAGSCAAGRRQPRPRRRRAVRGPSAADVARRAGAPALESTRGGG